MLATLILFALLTYGFAFLLADAKIFGCPIKDFVPALEGDHVILDKGVLPIRQLFLRLPFVRELLGCHFCMGTWCGIVAHLLLLWLSEYNQLILNSYFLLSKDGLGIAVGVLTAAVLGGPVCYVTDLLVQIAENVADSSENT